jgi:hypothetical protein
MVGLVIGSVLVLTGFIQMCLGAYCALANIDALPVHGAPDAAPAIATSIVDVPPAPV